MSRATQTYYQLTVHLLNIFVIKRPLATPGLQSMPLSLSFTCFLKSWDLLREPPFILRPLPAQHVQHHLCLLCGPRREAATPTGVPTHQRARTRPRVCLPPPTRTPVPHAGCCPSDLPRLRPLPLHPETSACSLVFPCAPHPPRGWRVTTVTGRVKRQR